MPWVSFDDQFTIHRKVDGLSDTAFRLHVGAIFWCARNLTDGVIPAGDLALVCPRLRSPVRLAAECVSRGVWHDARHDCHSEDCPAPRDTAGWVIHDYLRYQPSKTVATATRAGKSGGGKMGNHRRWHESRGINDPDCDLCVAPPSDNRSGSDSHSDSVLGLDSNSVSGPPPNPPSLSHPFSSSVVSHPSDRYARLPDDDPILQTTIDSIHERTGETVTHDHARVIAASVLSGQKPRKPAAYMRTAVMNDPHPRERFLPVAELASRPAWCGERGCDPETRLREDPGTGHPSRCPRCHPLRDESLKAAS